MINAHSGMTGGSSELPSGNAGRNPFEPCWSCTMMDRLDCTAFTEAA